MLDTLGFSITCPTIYVFLERFLKAAHADSKQSRMAKFITERTLQEYSMLNFKPSMIAASAVNLARRALCVSAWVSQAFVAASEFVAHSSLLVS